MRRALSLALAVWAQAAYAQARDDKPLAEALVTEGVRQQQAHAYEQALANFLEAYAKVPSPQTLIHIGATLRDMGRVADAANTYQRYLADPAAENVAEIKELLAKLDQELTVLTIRIAPGGAEVSIDDGPFVTVGATLTTRVQAGLHRVRARNGNASTELTVNGFAGESKTVTATVATDAAMTARAPDNVDGWLITGRHYATTDSSSRERRVLSGFDGHTMQAIVPDYAVEQDSTVTVDPPVKRKLGTGAIGVMRIDGKGRGIAGGLGVMLAPLDTVELELAALKAADWGVYAGLRVRFLSGLLRPYVGGGVPLFFFTDDTMMESAVALGLRAAAGLEVKVNGHLSLQADVGIEHFFNVRNALVHGKRPDETVFVPTVGVIGRL